MLAGDRSYAAGHFAFQVDGNSVGYATSVSGGPFKGKITTHNLGPDNIKKKHITTIKYEDITVEVGMGMSKGMYSWIKDALDKGHEDKDVKVIAKGFDVEVSDAHITKLAFPTLDASEKETALVVALSVEGKRKVTERKNKLPKKPAKAPALITVGSFRFEIDGVKCRVTKVEGLTIKMGTVKEKAKPAEFKIYVDAACASRLSGSASEKHAAARSARLKLLESKTGKVAAKVEISNVTFTHMQSAASESGKETFEVSVRGKSPQLSF